MPTTVITTVPPTVFDLHYWLFGVIVILAVTAFFDSILVERTGTSFGSPVFLLTTLSGMFIGSIVALVMNIIPWEVSAGLFFLLIYYLWRSRKTV